MNPALELAKRCRGTPRIAKPVSAWVRNLRSQREPMAKITLDIARAAFKCRRSIAKGWTSKIDVISKR